MAVDGELPRTISLEAKRHFAGTTLQTGCLRMLLYQSLPIPTLCLCRTQLSRPVVHGTLLTMRLQRRAVSLNAAALAMRYTRPAMARRRLVSISATRFRTFVSTSPRRQQAFQSQIDSISNASAFQPSLASAVPANPQTITEKIVQRHAVGLREGRKVKAGDYVTLYLPLARISFQH